MALAVAYTNTMNREKALDALSDWIRSNPKYVSDNSSRVMSHVSTGAASSAMKAAEVALEEKDEQSAFAHLINSFDRHGEVLNQYLAAARESAEIDPDVQIGLGLLYMLTAEYSKAASCFGKVLTVRPRDAKIWNRLGATYASMNRNAEAVEAYNQALQANPSYTRARTNLGISLIALGKSSLAAKEFLSAIMLSWSKDDIYGIHFI